MVTFSQKHGFKPIKKVLQIKKMDDDLRNSLWNCIDMHFLKKFKGSYMYSDDEARYFYEMFWFHYFKKPTDILDSSVDNNRDSFRKYFFSCDWCEVYDVIQFIIEMPYYDGSDKMKKFIDWCNDMLKREVAGWRVVGEVITPITSDEEIAEIEGAMVQTDLFQPVALHIKDAVKLLSDRESPNYRNSIKESISAVEAMSILITGKDKAKLGQALKRITEKVNLHPALQQSFAKLYGYTSDADGIRHALLEVPDLDIEDATFMLVSCSAFINYLKIKSSKAGVNL